MPSWRSVRPVPFQQADLWLRPTGLAGDGHRGAFICNSQSGGDVALEPDATSRRNGFHAKAWQAFQEGRTLEVVKADVARSGKARGRSSQFRHSTRFFRPLAGFAQRRLPAAAGRRRRCASAEVLGRTGPARARRVVLAVFLVRPCQAREVGQALVRGRSSRKPAVFRRRARPPPLNIPQCRGGILQPRPPAPPRPMLRSSPAYRAGQDEAVQAGISDPAGSSTLAPAAGTRSRRRSRANQTSEAMVESKVERATVRFFT